MPFTGASAKRIVLRIREANTRSPKFSSRISIASLACSVRVSTSVGQDALDLDVRVEVLADHGERVLQLDQAAHRQIFALHGDDHLVRGRQRVDREQPEARRRVDEDEVVVVLDRLRAPSAASARGRSSSTSRSPPRPGRSRSRRRRSRACGSPRGSRCGARARRTSTSRACRGRCPATWSGCPADPCRTHSTRCPSSANATARLSVVVVLATPPFWLANAITWLISTLTRARSSAWRPKPSRASIRSAARSLPLWYRTLRRVPALARQAPAVRHRQGRRRQVDGGDRARAARGPARTAHDRRRAARARSGSRACSARDAGEQFRELELDAGPVHDLDRPAAGDGGVPARQGRHASARRSARAGCSRPSPWPRPGCASCSASGRCGSSRSSTAALAAPLPYDLVIVDAPGHRTRRRRCCARPSTFADIARVGPIAHQGRTIARHDRRPRVHRRDRGGARPRRCRSTRR